MRGWKAACITALCFCVVAPTVSAQTGGRQTQAQQQRRAQPPRARSTAPPRPGTERVRILFDGGVAWAPGSFAQDFSLTKNVESTPIRTDLSLRAGGVFDIGARVRVTRTLSVGAVGFLGSARAGGTLDAEIPHPFYFDQRRAISGDLSKLTHSERGVHIELAYPVSIANGREITVFGGPSYIAARQELVTDVRYDESYPFDAATFTGAVTHKASKGALGVNAGADITWRLSRSLRGGALIRYTFANLTLDPASGNTVRMHAGGLQIAGGIRVLIQKRPVRQGPPARPRR